MKRISMQVLPIQTAVATASPSAWQDGLVSGSDATAVAVVFMDGRSMSLSTEAQVAAGEPVAWHPVAEVLANGTAWYRARPLR